MEEEEKGWNPLRAESAVEESKTGIERGSSCSTTGCERDVEEEEEEGSREEEGWVVRRESRSLSF